MEVVNEVHGLQPVASACYRVPFAGEGRAQKVAEGILVINDQQRLGSSRERLVGYGRDGGRGSLDQRQVKLERAAHIRGAINLDVAPVTGHDAVDDGQTEARALTRLLRRKERLEDAGPDLGGHSDARIGDLKAGVVLIPLGIGVWKQITLNELCRYGDATPVGHGVPGIHAELEDDLLVLVLVRQKGGQPVSQVHGERDFAGKGLGQECDQVPDLLVEVEGREVDLRLSAKSQDLSDEADRAL